jgi:Protein of unknown function (DUF4058)
MNNPFPGMNPYLEQPEFWSDFHTQLVTALARVLIPQVLPKYRVVTEKWIYQIADAATIGIGRPDVTVQQRRGEPSKRAIAIAPAATSTQPIQVKLPLPEEVQQAYLEVRDVATQEVVTTIEVLSPANKRSDGRRKYALKRQAVLGSLTHLVEIDLLRDGEPLPILPPSPVSHYRILVSRSDTRPMADLYAFNLGDRIPDFPIPLRLEDTEPVINLQAIVNELYEQLGYAYFIDYTNPPPPPWLSEEVAAIKKF